jgi:serine/threonine protein kinase/Tol biopolymer transport system component
MRKCDPDRCLLTPERWAQIEELFHRAVQCDPMQRISLLDEACDGDLALRRKIEALLSSEESASDDMQAAVRSGLDAVSFPLVGETVSHYYILDGLGVGGMGLVYRAEDTKLGRHVALKFLPEESTNDPAALGRFEREARSASALEHPSICPIYEFGEHEGQPFLVMQLLEGQTLRDLISAAGPGKPNFVLDKLLDLTVQITAGLEAAHGQGIIHRDIKPANIFVTKQGQAKILDFGLAKLSRGNAMEEELGQIPSCDTDAKGAADSTPPLATPDPLLSRTGLAMGTAGYMSPEQARGEKLDARTDLFSFGLVLYEMATGQRAFRGDTGPALHDAILKNIPAPVRQLNPDLPPKLETIIRKALEKDRDSRYQSASELRADLQALTRELESRHSLRWWIPASAAALTLMIAGGIIWSVRQQHAPTQVGPQIKLRQLTTNSPENRVLTGAISPDGKYLAYTDLKGMHVKLVVTGETKVVPQPEGLNAQDVHWDILATGWFPDGTTFLANAYPAALDPSRWTSETASVWEVSALGGAPRKLRDHAIAWSVSPYDSSIAFGTKNDKLGEREIWLMGKNGEQPSKLFDTGDNSSIGPLFWLPERERVLYLSTDATGGSLVSRDLKGGPVTTLIPPSELDKMGDGVWSPDGRLIFSMKEPAAIHDTCNYWEMRLNARTGETVEKPRRFTNWADFCVSNPSVTADGERLAFLQMAGRDSVYVADLDAAGTRISNSRRLVLDDSYDYLQNWAPDSKAILFISNRDGRNGIYKQSLDQDTSELVSSGEGEFRDSRVSPDGKWVMAFLSPKNRGASDPEELIRVPVTGGSPEVILKASANSGFSCAGPHSDLCVFEERSEDRKQAIVTSLDPVKGRGPELTRFDLDPNEDFALCEISPDGTRLAVSPSPAGPIQILSLRGRRLSLVPIGRFKIDSNVFWAADGKGIYFGSKMKGGTVLLHLDMTGKPHIVWENHGGGWALGMPSPDGRHLAINGETMNSNMWMMENF